MIPKVIHYCWFGGNPLPKSVKKCMNSWKKYFPDYEIKEWNESNYDVNKNQYISEAYKCKKYAFVSDYARFDILYQHGGVYFDTDVEVIKPFDDILVNGAFMGCEEDGGDSNNIQVNPGLGIAAESGNEFYGQVLSTYKDRRFINDDGSLNTVTVVKYTTDELIKIGLKNIVGIQKVGGITVYPKEYFNPRNFGTGKLKKTDNTHSIHWYSMTWMSPIMRFRSNITRILHRIFRVDSFKKPRKK